jgi:hypothetical protein
MLAVQGLGGVMVTEAPSDHGTTSPRSSVFHPRTVTRTPRPCRAVPCRYEPDAVTSPTFPCSW